MFLEDPEYSFVAVDLAGRWLAKFAGLQDLPGLAPGSEAAEESLRVPHGTEGRLLRPALRGVRNRKVEGPRAYAPRLSRPSV